MSMTQNQPKNIEKKKHAHSQRSKRTPSTRERRSRKLKTHTTTKMRNYLVLSKKV